MLRKVSLTGTVIAKIDQWKSVKPSHRSPMYEHIPFKMQ
jgi:hypothetical protein